MERPISDPEQPDVNSARALCPQLVRRGNDVVANSPTAALNVDSDNVASMIRLDLRTNVPLVYFVAETGRLFAGAAWQPLLPARLSRFPRLSSVQPSTHTLVLRGICR